MIAPRTSAERWDLALILALCLCKGIVWTVSQPPLQTPDEAAHFTYVQFLAENGALPRVGPTGSDSAEAAAFARAVGFDEIRFRPEARYRPTAPQDGLSRISPDGNSSAAGYPPGHYAIAALGYRTAYGSGIAARFYAARFASVALGLAAVAFAWCAGRACFSGDRGAPMAMALVFGLQPMGSMATASVNNDALLVTAAAGAFAVVACRPRHAGVWLGLAIGAGLLAKPQMLVVGVATLPGLVLAEWRGTRAALRTVVSTFVSAFALFGAWAFVAIARFGSPFGAMLFQTVHEGDPSLSPYLRESVLSLTRARTLWLDTFWGRFGWLDTALPAATYAALLCALHFAAAGALTAFLRREEPGRAALAFCATFVVANLGFLYAVEALYVRQYRTTMLQGRYLLTALVPVAFLVVAGLRGLAAETARPWASLAVAWAALLLNAVSLRAILFRYYGVGLRGAIADPGVLRGVVPEPLFVFAWVAAAGCIALGAGALVRLASFASACRFRAEAESPRPPAETPRDLPPIPAPARPS